MKLIKKAAILLAAVFLLNTVSVFAAEPAAANPELTLSEAFKRAKDVSATIAQYKDSITSYEEERDRLSKDARNLTGTAAILKYQDEVANNKKNLDAAKVNLQVGYDSLEIEVLNAFITIANAEDSLAMYDMNLALSERNFKITEVKKNLGLISENDFLTAKTNLEKSKTSRADKVDAIDKAYRDLNKLLSRKLEDRYELVFDIEYEKLGDVYLSSYIGKVTSNDQTIKGYQAQLGIYEYQLETYILRYVNEATGEIKETSTREAYERNIDKVNRDIADRKKTIEEAVTKAYNDIAALERSYELNLADLENKYTQYEIKKVQLEIGKITQIELDTALYEIRSLESTIRTQVYNHHVSVLKFNNLNMVAKASAY